MARSSAWLSSVTSDGDVFRLPEPVPTEKLARLAKRYGLRFIALFGSCARGENGPRSDVDVAVMPAARRRPNLMRLYGDLVPILLDERLDIVDMRHAPPLLAWHVACEGKRLYAAEWGDWVWFCSRAVREWDDMRQFEHYHRAIVDRRLAEWGVS